MLFNPGDWRPSMAGLSFNQIGGEEAAKLEDAFTLKVVFKAVSDLNRDKALCLAGFLLALAFQLGFYEGGFDEFFQ